VATAHEGQELEGRDGFRLKLLQINDDLLEMEARYTGRGRLPPEHYHPRQDGEELRYVAGQRFDVPAGTPHQMAGDGPARVHWEVRPALRTAEFFEEAYSGEAGPDFYERFADEFRLTASSTHRTTRPG
jgi:hypothetical protein